MESVPGVFVLMGNFQSYSATSASTDYGAIKQNFSALAAALQRHRRLTVRPRPQGEWKISAKGGGALSTLAILIF